MSPLGPHPVDDDLRCAITVDVVAGILPVAIALVLTLHHEESCDARTLLGRSGAT